MGLFDLPAPLFGWLDGQLAAVLPPALRLLLWGLVGAVLSMELYRLLSPQAKIQASQAELKRLQGVLAGYDGAFAEAWPLLGRMQLAALRRVGLVAPAAILASLPLLCLLVWLSNAYGYRYPEAGALPAIEAAPAAYRAAWAEDAGRPPLSIVVNGPQGEPVAEAPLEAAVPTLHKRQWWNLLIGNPAGYLPADAAVARLDIKLSQQEVLNIGPAWLRGWEAIFFVVLTFASLVIKAFRRIA